ncbi:MAG: SDR family NAD(P)-dependent oxidoreductase [Methanotrichaceae archaeon]|nr:SDR family NAD(P)-dependent oxidoreductase [Methanotrichaceae archaeon]
MTNDLNGEKVLLTGITGFIGSHLARRLVAEGAIVCGFVKKSSSTRRIKDIEENIQIFRADLRDYEAVYRAVKKIEPQKIFHLAACVDANRSFEFMDEMIKVNVEGTINLLRALNDVDYDCFINTGSSEEYGDNPVPFREDQEANPVSPYSASKACTTLFCRMLHKTMGLPIVTLRPFLIYGPGQDSNMLIPELIKSILRGHAFKMTGGEQTREFNYVDDIVDGFVKASTSQKAIGEVINIGNGQEYKIIDVVEQILELMNSEIKPAIGALPYRPGEAWHFYCDNTKAKEILGWTPRISLRDGLERTINWYNEHQT